MDWCSSAGSQTIDVGAGATLQMMRTLANGAIHQGLVAFPTTGGISEALMAYMQTSEQVTSVVAVDTVVGDEGLLGAGGYMVQLLPEAGQGPLGAMIERLERFGSLRGRLGARGFRPGRIARGAAGRDAAQPGGLGRGALPLLVRRSAGHVRAFHPQARRPRGLARRRRAVEPVM